ncbi:MAG: PIN domain-containing protein [Micropruina sp.]|uniref:type II toxin-antitoxin system VapC family toxin n=1 Tax=Micropruina sp. TaxID=2737536 RepID=UPI0039E45FDF
MIALDTNILVYAHRADSPHHAAAQRALHRAITGRSAVGVPWPVLHEFLAIVTHRRIYQPATPMPDALAAAEALTGAPGVHLLGEGADQLPLLSELLASGTATGARVHDARIAAICLAHGVDALWSADRDFSWFPQLKVVNPLS